MSNYIDGFLLPIPNDKIEEYKKVVEKVAEIWLEYGALSYQEFIGDDLNLEGTKSFAEMAKAKADEVIVFGFVVFPSKEIRDSANKKVPLDPRMETLIAPLLEPEKLIFDASKMLYGGFKAL